MGPHPIRLVVEDDLRRSRLTVFFRILLALPHLLWLWIWFGVTFYLVAPIAWILALALGRLPEPLWRYFCSLVRYATHVYAFIFMAGNPFPGFTGRAGRYPIDLEIAEPERQSRWKTLIRLILVYPALLLSNSLLVFLSAIPVYDETTDEVYYIPILWGVALVTSFFAWFVCLVRGRMPTGFRDLLAYTLRYAAQTWGYLFLLTDRYPDADPNDPAATQPTPEKPVKLTIGDDLRRSRLTVFFRLLLVFPHVVWFLLWTAVVTVAVLLGWLATLATGRLPEFLHRFFGAYVRYSTHLFAFLYLVANPFPGFAGVPGSYPVDLEIAPRARQSRWKTLFRLILVLPAHMLAAFLGAPLSLVALFGWFVGLILGRMPEGLRNLGAYCLRYSAQTYAYVLLLTDSYPYSGPTEYVEPEPEEPVAAWPALPLSPSFSS